MVVCSVVLEWPNYAAHLYDLSSPPSFCSQRTSVREIVLGGFALRRFWFWVSPAADSLSPFAAERGDSFQKRVHVPRSENQE